MRVIANRVEGPLAGIRRPSSAGSALACPSILFLLLSLRYLRINYTTDVRRLANRGRKQALREAPFRWPPAPLTGKPGRQHDGQPERGQKFDFAMG